MDTPQVDTASPDNTSSLPQDTPVTRIENIWGGFPQVTSIPTYTPKNFRNSFAINGATLYYYDITANAWRTLGQSLTYHIQYFTASGTWTKPAGVSSVIATVLGGGGNGGAGAQGASGGGAGGLAKGAVTVTGNVTVTVGAVNGDSTFVGSTTLTGHGGSNGVHNTVGGASNFLGAGGAGGTGVNGDINITGQSGASVFVDTAVVTAPSGNGGSPGLGLGMGGQAVVVDSNSLGSGVSYGNSPNATGYGAGGAGASGATPGTSAGTGGIVIVEWYE